MADFLKKSKAEITKIFKQYSVKDICDSLFILSLWLPNIASPVTGERIRDKMAASKKKGMWMNGNRTDWLCQ